nr:hypothetical protein [uncultured Campylobacter sp.]
MSEDYENCKLAVNLEALNLSIRAAKFSSSAFLRRGKSAHRLNLTLIKAFYH